MKRKIEFICLAFIIFLLVFIYSVNKKNINENVKYSLHSPYAVATDFGVGLIPNGTTVPDSCNPWGFFINTTTNTLYYCNSGGTYTSISSSGGTWGSITGTLSNQSDLNTALDSKLSWAWGGALTATDATPEVEKNTIYDCDDTTLTITNFVDSDGDHSEFTDGDQIMVLMNDPDVTIDFSDNSYIEGNANTDFTGSASQIVAIVFTFRDTDGDTWYADLNMGYSDATTFPVTLKVGAPLEETDDYDFSTSDTTKANLFGHATHHSKCTSGNEPCTYTLAAVEAGMAFCIDLWTEYTVRLDPNGSEILVVDGTAFTAGYYATSSDIGDSICCEAATTADTWGCTSYSENGTGNSWDSQ